MESISASLLRVRKIKEWSKPFYIDASDCLGSLDDKDKWKSAAEIANNDIIIFSLRVIQALGVCTCLYLLLSGFFHGAIEVIAAIIASVFVCQVGWMLIIIRADQLARNYQLLRPAIVGQIVRGVLVAALFSLVPSTVFGVLFWNVIPVRFRFYTELKNGREMDRGVFGIGALFHYSFFWMACHRWLGEGRIAIFGKMLISRRRVIFDSFEYEFKYATVPVVIFATLFLLFIQVPLHYIFHYDALLPLAGICLVAFPLLSLYFSVTPMVWFPMVANEYIRSGESGEEPFIPDDERLSQEDSRSAGFYVLIQQAKMLLCIVLSLVFLYIFITNNVKDIVRNDAFRHVVEYSATVEDHDVYRDTYTEVAGVISVRRGSWNAIMRELKRESDKNMIENLTIEKVGLVSFRPTFLLRNCTTLICGKKYLVVNEEVWPDIQRFINTDESKKLKLKLKQARVFTENPRSDRPDHPWVVRLAKYLDGA